MVKSFEEKNVMKLLLKFAIPATAGNLIFALYHLADRFFIGKYLGSYALSGMTLSFPFFNFIMGIIGLISIGGMNLIPIYLGKKDENGAKKILSNIFIMFLATYVVIVFLNLFFLKDLLILFGATENSLPFAYKYLNIMSYGLIFMFFNFGLSVLIRAEGNPKKDMQIAFIGCVSNIIFDWLFIAVFNWGVTGAAFATVAGNVVGFIMVMDYYFISKKSKLNLDLNFINIDYKLMKESLSIGLSPFLRKLGTTTVMAILMRQLFKYGGDMAVASFGIIDVLSTLTLLLIGGIGSGAQPIISYSYGANDYKKVKKVFYFAMGVSTVIASISFIILYNFGEHLIKIFNDDKALIEAGKYGLKFYILAMPLLSFQTLGVEFFQAINKPKISIFLNLFRKVVMTIPVLYIFSNIFGLIGVWLAIPIVDFIAAGTTMIFIRKHFKIFHFKKDEELVLKEI